MVKQLKIKLLPNGMIEMETVGVKGKQCLEYAKFMEKIANAEITKQKLTDEYYQENETYQDNIQNLYEGY